MYSFDLYSLGFYTLPMDRHLFVLSVVAAASGGRAPKSRLTTQYVVVGGVNRSYELQVPSDTYPVVRENNKNVPLIFSFHGDGGTASEQAKSDHLREVAGGVAIIVHGQGIGEEEKTGRQHPTWNGE